MAEIQGNTVNIECDFTGVGTTYDKIVCLTSGSASSTRPITTTQTNCGSKVAVGVAEWTIAGDFVAETAPGGSEASMADTLVGYNAGSLVKVRVQDPAGTGTNFYLSGDAYITDFEITWATEEVVGFSATWTVTGTLDVTP